MDRLEVAGVRIMDTAFTNTANESPSEKPVAPAVAVTVVSNTKGPAAKTFELVDGKTRTLFW